MDFGADGDLRPTRRMVLAAAGGAAVVAAVAACSPSDSTKPPDVPAGTSLATLADIPVGGAVPITFPGSHTPGLVARPTETTAACFSAVCTHYGCTVKPAEHVLRCPCHGSEFDVRTGAVVRGPAQDPLPRVKVAVRNGRVVAA